MDFDDLQYREASLEQEDPDEELRRDRSPTPVQVLSSTPDFDVEDEAREFVREDSDNEPSSSFGRSPRMV